ncbi:uncharacterized protein ARMOST_20168 [Armillaria ostoyae]|uniref:Uncharacterized protein n=1 Tax=Armillaria ostoyae TaxID=47428 RepID=A0A284S6M0_ARMOS|nr:uncharacterized protein ARMOST_20168 [Armillaria ostoyae]
MSPSMATQLSTTLSLSATSRSKDETTLRKHNIAEHEKCEDKMKASVEWLRRNCADATARATGRLMPALLINAQVKEQKLEEVTAVRNPKHVEAAIYDENIPSITPQRQDTRTSRIPVPKSTLDAKSSVVTTTGKKAGDARVQCRQLHQASIKKGKYEKWSIELEVFQDLFDNRIADIKIRVDMKTTLGLR